MQITAEHLDAIQELLNIGVGRAAGSLNQMLEKPVRLRVPSIKFEKIEELSKEVPFQGDSSIASVQLPFKGSYQGSACLLFPTESATTLVKLLAGDATEPDTLNSLKEATLTEIGNIVLNGVMGSLANVLHNQLIYSVPFYQETSILGLLRPSPSDESEMALLAHTQFLIEDFNISGDIMLMLGVPDLTRLLHTISELFSESKSMEVNIG